LVVGDVERPQGGTIAQTVATARRYRSLLQRITELETRVEDRFGVLVRVAGSISQGVREAAFENSADLILLEWPGLGSHRPSDRNIEDLVADPPSDLLLVRLDPTGGGVRRADRGPLPVPRRPRAPVAPPGAPALAPSPRRAA